MPRKFDIDKSPKWRRIKAKIAKTIIGAVSGWDSFFTIFKAAIQNIKVVSLLGTAGILSSTTITTSPTYALLKGMLALSMMHYVIPIGIVALIGSAVYIASGLKDEYDKDAEEDRKLKEAKLLKKLDRKYTEKVQRALEYDLKVQKGTHPTGVPEDHIEKIPDLRTLDESDLLKYYLKTYLKKLGLLDIPLSQVDKAANFNRKKGELPSQASIERLIRDITPDHLDRSDEFFTLKLAAFLNQSSFIDVPPDFAKRLNIAFKFPLPFREPKDEIKLQPEPKRRGFFRRTVGSIKQNIFGYARGNTAMGGIVWTASVGGWIPVGSAMAFPLILSTIVLGVLSGFASWYYRKKVEKSYKTNMDNADAKVKHYKNRYELIYKLDHLNDKTFIDPGISAAPKGQSNDIPEELALNDLESKYNPSYQHSDYVRYVPASVRKRAEDQLFAQAMYGYTVGAVIGISIPTLAIVALSLSAAPVTIPLLALTVPGAFSGVLLGFRYARSFYKLTRDGIIDEGNLTIAVQKKHETLLRSVDESRINAGLAKSLEQLLSELIDYYIDYAKLPAKEKTRPSAKLLPEDDEEKKFGDIRAKKEKILLLIEKASGFERSRNQDGTPNSDDDSFYENLALKLMQNPATAVGAKEKLTALKETVTGKAQPLINLQGKTLDKGLTATDVNRVFMKQLVPAFGALGIAIPLGCMLFGALAVISLATVFISVMGIFSYGRKLEGMQSDHIALMKQKDLKLDVIHRAAKLEDKVGHAIAPGRIYTTLFQQEEARAEAAAKAAAQVELRAKAAARAAAQANQAAAPSEASSPSPSPVTPTNHSPRSKETTEIRSVELNVANTGTLWTSSPYVKDRAQRGSKIFNDPCLYSVPMFGVPEEAPTLDDNDVVRKLAPSPQPEQNRVALEAFKEKARKWKTELDIKLRPGSPIYNRDKKPAPLNDQPSVQPTFDGV